MKRMHKQSAGLLLFRRVNEQIEVFLVHPGGPFWSGKDDGAWSIPKGEFTEDEVPLEAAKREFKEETGFTVAGEFYPLQPLKQPSGKVVYAWAMEGNLDSQMIKSNTFPLEWPPHSGEKREFPEVDRAGWFTPDIARIKILKGQAPFLDQLEQLIPTLQ
jgi:predicted NUDIX family NTP pyrophosphohydrolase